MHDTALLTGRAFFETYARPGHRTLDIGSRDVNGTLKQFVPVGVSYVGCDVEPGPNVDVVLPGPYYLPFLTNSFDLIVSTSCLEHDEFFWLTLTEMSRIIAPGGFIYVSAPTGGDFHQHPVDCWRFYPDAGVAMANWMKLGGPMISLIESFVLPPRVDRWCDFVAVFGKRDLGGLQTRPGFIADRFSDAQHRRP